LFISFKVKKLRVCLNSKYNCYNAEKVLICIAAPSGEQDHTIFDSFISSLTERKLLIIDIDMKL